MHFSRIALAATIAAAASFSAALAGQVTVNDGWFRALPANLPAGGYFKLHNGSDKAVILMAAESPACGMVMVHRSVQSSGMNRMMPADALEVAAGGTLVFAPGGYHLMCMQPTPTMKPGAIVTVTLRFADGHEITGDFAVRGANGT